MRIITFSATSLLLLLTHINALASEQFDKLLIAKPKVILSDTSAEQQKWQKRSDSSFKQALTSFKQELPRYFKTPPQIKTYQQSDFYQRHDEQGAFFLKQLAPKGSNALVVFGQIEVNQINQTIEVTIEGFDGNKSTDWPILTAPFATSSIDYLPEIYNQLLFELLNEPSKNGLKPLKSKKSGKPRDE